MIWIKKHKLIFSIIIWLLIAILLPFIFFVYERYKPYYTAEDFYIELVTNNFDAN